MLALVVSLALHATPLYMPGPAEQERFRTLFAQGEQLYKDAGKSQDPLLYGAAIHAFSRADAIHPTPEVAYDLAKSYEKIGAIPFATYYYRLYLRRSPNAADALDVADRVGTVLAKNEAEGRGFLEVTAFGATQLSIAGQSFPEAPVAIFLAPGDYELTGRFPDGAKRVAVSIRTGKTTSLSFEPLPAPMISSTEGAPDAAIDVSASAGQHRLMRTSSSVVAGLGLAALITGTVLGVMSANDASQLSNHNLRVSQAQAYASSANAEGLGANLSWGVGGALVATGVVMWILSRPEPGPGLQGNP